VRFQTLKNSNWANIMQSGLYVTLSSQINLQRLVDTIANNVANANTAGFRADDIQFQSILSPNTPEPVAFANRATTKISTRQGELSKTGNPLDVAVQGDAWFSMQTPQGTIYTRDGRLKMTATGELQSVNGYPLLDVSGSPIQINPSGGAPVIGADGTIEQGGRRAGSIGLFVMDPDAKLSRFDNSGVIPDKQPVPTVDFVRYGVAQGYVEQSNVNPITEMSRLIYVQRAFDAVSSTIGKSESALSDAITQLGSTS
jgi:flagellar basal-body rod protein FlgF